MSKKDKLIEKIKKGIKISYAEAANFLSDYGYSLCTPNGGSSHVTFRKDGTNPITLIKNRNELKSYQMDMLKGVLDE